MIKINSSGHEYNIIRTGDGYLALTNTEYKLAKKRAGKLIGLINRVMKRLRF